MRRCGPAALGARGGCFRRYEMGQQTPIIVVRDSARWVVVDGYKRVRAVHRLGQDVVRATEWALSETEGVAARAHAAQR